MKFLKIGKAHIKNENGFKLLAQEADATIIESDSKEIFHEIYDLVWIPQGFYHSTQFPNAKRILFGPHNFVFPNEPWVYMFEPKFTNSLYTSLSPWIYKLYSQFPFCMQVKSLPFPVDIERFKPAEPKIYEYDCFVYFKNRSKKYLHYIEELLKENKLTYNVLVYGEYKEEDYISILNKTRFGIWIGCHESQGFALEEALSMNVPLLVFDVESLNDEVNSFGNHSYLEYKDKYDLSATSCSYWDTRCGIRFTDLNEFNKQFNNMNIKYNTFQPREFILETLSPSVCYKRILDAFN